MIIKSYSTVIKLKKKVVNLSSSEYFSLDDFLRTKDKGNIAFNKRDQEIVVHNCFTMDDAKDIEGMIKNKLDEIGVEYD